MKKTCTNISRELLRSLIPAAVVALAAAAHGQSAYFQAVENLNPAAYWPLQETNPTVPAFIEPNIGSLGAVANMYYSTPDIAYLYPQQSGAIVNDSDTAVKFLGSANGFGLVPTTDNRVSLPPGGPFTVEVWTQPTGNNSYQGIVDQRGALGVAGPNNTYNAAGWCLNQNYVPLEDDGSGTASGALQGWSFAVYNGQGAFGGAQALAPYQFQDPLPQPNGWYYLVGVFDGTNALLYVNGTLISDKDTLTQPMPAGTKFVPDTWDPIQFGASRGIGGNVISGFLDEIAVYTNVLTAAQITNHYYQATNGNANYAATVLNDKAYMYWRMDAQIYSTPGYGSGFTVATNYGSLASSMNNIYTGQSGVNAAIYQPGTLPGVQGPSYAGFGSSSYACAFNGLTGAVDAGYLGALNPAGNNGTNSFTILGWWKGNPCDNNGRVNSLAVHGNSSWRTTVINGAVHFNYGPGAELAETNVNVNDGNWHMFAGVYNQTNATQYLYIDAAFATNLPGTASITGNPTLEILLGGSPDYANTNSPTNYNTGQRYLAGELAHVAYFTNALTLAQIQSLYSAAEPPPLIQIQPAAGVSAISGGTTNVFTVTASGAAPLVYQWYVTNAGGLTALTDTGTNIVGSATTTLTLTNLVNSESGSYFVVISNNYGAVTSILSGLQVDSQPVIVSQAPGASTLTMYTNQSYVLSVTALGNAPLTYQWYTNGVADTTAGTGPTYLLTGVLTSMTGNTYQCVVGNSYATATNIQTTLTVLSLPASLAANAYSQAIINLSPAGYWPMHEVAAPTAADIETNLGTLGAAGAAYYGDWDIIYNNTNIAEIDRGLPGALANDPDPAAGLVRGPGSYLIVPHTASPQTTIKPPFTLETWAYPTEIGSYGILIGQGGGAGLNAGPNYGGFDLIWSGTTNSFSLAVYNGSGSANDEYKTTSVYPENQWYHVVATYDGTNIALWINGQAPTPTSQYPSGYQGGSSNYTTFNPDTWSPLCIGSGRWGTGGANGNPFGGVLDEVAIYTNILSSNTIVQHYNDGISGANGVYKNDVLTNNPLLYYRMDAPTWFQPPRSQWPVLVNYGTNVGNGVYTPGTAPGSATAPLAGLSSTAVAPLNGMGQFADCGNALVYNDFNYNPFSYCALFRGLPTDDRQYQCIMSANDSSYRATLHGNSGTFAGHGDADVTSTTSNLNDGNWHQMLTVAQHGVSTGSTGTTNYFTNLLFLDGSLMASNNGTGSNNVFGSPGPEACIGNEWGFNITNSPGNPAGERCLAGSICEAAFFNYALPTNVASTLFNAAGIPPYFTIQPVSATTNAGVNFTNTALAISSGGITAYQWYTNGVALSGQTRASLVLTNLTAAMSNNDYYVVATSSYGTVTSAAVSLTILTKPVIISQVPVTTNIIVYSGANIAFSVTASGKVPLSYYWYSNGVLAAGTTSSAYTVSNVQYGASYTNYCVVSNSLGTATTGVWNISVVPVPAAPFPQAVLALKPIGYWRLAEAEQGNGDDGVIAYDYIADNNGIYTNTILGQQGYNSADSSFPNYDPETCAQFASYATPNSLVYNIPTIDFSAPGGVSSVFTVQAWAQSTGSAGNTPTVVSKGNYYGEEFTIDAGNSLKYRFEVRSAVGTAYNANSTVAANDSAWHFLVGVCDQVHTNVTFYIDGTNAATVTITNGAGITNNPTVPMTIGARSTTPGAGGSFDQQFVGYVNDVAVFNYALTSNQIAAEYYQSGVAPQITLAFTTTNVSYGATVTIPATAHGTSPVGYQWLDGNNGNNPIPGATNTTLVVSNITSSDSYSLQATNAFGTNTSGSVYVNVITGGPQQVQDIIPLTPLVVAGSSITFSVVYDGSPVLTNAWQLNGNAVTNNSRISGANTQTLTINNIQLSDAGVYQFFVTNGYGNGQSSQATLTVTPFLQFAGGPGYSSQGTTITWPSSNILQLTASSGSEANAAFYSSPLYIGAFKASFNYQCVSGPSSSADGATFCIQNDPRGAAALGGGGGGIGVTTITPSVEFEFNIYSGNGIGGVGVSFNTNGIIGPVVSTAPLVVNNGDIINTVVTYQNGVVSVTLTDNAADTSYSASAQVNIPAAVGANFAYVGFTGGDGASKSTQQISNFSFVSLLSLSAQAAAPNLLLTWPDASGGYTLQQSASLSSAHWTAVPAAAALVNGTNQDRKSVV